MCIYICIHIYILYVHRIYSYFIHTKLRHYMLQKGKNVYKLKALHRTLTSANVHSPKPPGFKQRRAWHFVEVSDPVGPVHLGSVSQSSSSNVPVAPRPQIWSSQFPWALGRRWRHPKMPWTMAPWPSCRPSPWQQQNGKMAKYHGYLSCKD